MIGGRWDKGGRRWGSGAGRQDSEVGGGVVGVGGGRLLSVDDMLKSPLMHHTHM